MKPIILVSKCLSFSACRYDGTMIGSDFIQGLAPYVEFVTVCPELAIGLPVPRNAIRLVIKDNEKRLVDAVSGRDHTDKMNDFADRYLSGINQLHGAILKSRSPSCGIKDVKTYASHGKVPCLEPKMPGFFGQAVMKHHPHLPVEDEGRLRNYEIRDYFLTRIFTLARFEPIDMAGLVKYHSDNKYLLMAYHQELQKVLGRLVANHEKQPFEKVRQNYYETLKMVFSSPVNPGKNENVLLHIFGYFSKQLSEEERHFFLKQLKQYRARQLPLPALLSLLRSWVIRFDMTYLKQQTIFNAYPDEIISVSDSGKGRKLK